MVPGIIHTFFLTPTEGHWKFLGGGDSMEKDSMKLNWNFLGGAKQKTFRGGSMHGYFLQLNFRFLYAGFYCSS